MNPFEIIIGGQRLDTWTEATLSRTKDELTGSLNVTVFAGATPPTPILTSVLQGAPIQVYVGGQLAFTGTIDKRQGTGAKTGDQGTSESSGDTKGTSISVSMGPNEYTVKITARGKTKRLIDSSHQHPTTNMLQPTTKEVVEKLVEPWKTPIEWLGEVIKLDKMRFRDGARVVDELHRVALENCYFMYETRDGKLRVTDGVGTGSGDPLILGQNILTFTAEQSEDDAKSKVKVKGQRSKKEIWGEQAVLKTFKEIEDKWVKDFAPLIVQHYGDADEKTLERRARFEMNKRSSLSKKIKIEVFHVQTPSGRPWDIGTTHYVQVPPEGIFDVFECTELTYTVQAKDTLKTSLTLSPPPSGGAGGPAGGFGLQALTQLVGMGMAARNQAGVVLTPGNYPAPWTGPQMNELPLVTLADAIKRLVTQDSGPPTIERPPPEKLPPWFGEDSSK